MIPIRMRSCDCWECTDTPTSVVQLRTILCQQAQTKAHIGGVERHVYDEVLPAAKEGL